MKIVVAIDSFKGSLSSARANQAVCKAASELGFSYKAFNVADGGEGTIDALCSEFYEVKVLGPLGKKIKARYGVMDNTAVIEAAQAVGLTLLSEKQRDPMNTTTYGVGEMIKDAVNRGYRKFIIGIGGSCTNDGGFGLLSALGCRFKDKDGREIAYGAKGLKDFAAVDARGIMPEIKKCELLIACDVDNPLCGKNGCSEVFAPQKGAKEEDIPLMDKWLENYAQILGCSKDIPGAGAAGGLGYAFLYLGAILKSGIDIVLGELNIEEHIRKADIVITGEGKIDNQSIRGKTPLGVARLAKKYGKKVIAFCGKCESEIEGIESIYEINKKDTPLSVAYEKAYENLYNTAYNILKGINK